MEKRKSNRGRKKGVPNGQSDPENPDKCWHCEGLGFKYGVGNPCGACEGTGSDLVRRQVQKVYNSKNKLPLNHNLKI